MKKQFSIHDEPFSDETKVLRRNCMISSGICLFIGLTGELPEKFSMLGISFSSKQQQVISWFIFGVSLYLFLHFLSMAVVEFAKWIHPLFTKTIKKKVLLTRYSHAFSEVDFHNIPDEVNQQDLNSMSDDAESEAEWQAQRKLRLLYGFIYIRLFIEVLFPVCLSLWGMFELAWLITNALNRS